jgi:iron complex outermembrane receptor protein
MVNIPLSDIARFRISGDHQERDGYLHNTSGVGPRDYNNVNYTAIRASLVVDLTPELENYTIISYSRSNTNGGFNKLIACNKAGSDPVDPATGAANFIGVFSCAQLAKEKAEGAGFYDAEANFANPKSLLTQWQIINTTTWHESDTLTIKNIASYGQFKDVQRSPLFGTNWTAASLPAAYTTPFFPGGPSLFGNGTLPQFTEINPATGAISDQSTATEELQVQGSALNDRLTYQGGVYGEFSDPLSLTGNESYSLALCTDVATLQCSDPVGTDLGVPGRIGAVNFTAGKTHYRDLGVYAQSTYKFTDQLSLTGGIRYTSDRQTNVSQRITNTFPAPNTPVTACTDINQAETNCTESLKQKSHKPTWLIDLDYKPTENILAYAKYSRGYRAGGVFANAPSDHRTFSPEKVDSYEAGIKTSFRGAVSGTFNVDGFYNNFSNQQLQLGFQNNQNYMGTGLPAPASPTTAIINAGKSRIWGIEVESSITPFTGFTVDVGYTYLNATIRKIAPFSTTDPLYQAANGNIAPGSPLELAPKNKVAVTGTYTLPLDPSIGRISVGATFVHTDKQLTNYVYPTAADVAAYGGNFEFIQKTNLLNLNASWNNVVGLPIDLAAFATNVTNKKYFTYIPGLGGLTGSGAEFAGVGQPRFFGGRVRYHF